MARGRGRRNLAQSREAINGVEREREVNFISPPSLEVIAATGRGFGSQFGGVVKIRFSYSIDKRCFCPIQTCF